MKTIALGCVLVFFGCNHPIEFCAPSEEVCDGVDNDCNGVVDDIRQEGCYTGTNPIEVAFGACRAGRTACEGGVQVCVGDVHPAEEVCDGVDNDCDGQVDEDLLKDTDIVFVIDNSEQAKPYLSAMEMSLNMTVSMLAQNKSLRWGAVTGSDEGPRQLRFLSDPDVFLGLNWSVADQTPPSQTLDLVYDLATTNTVSMKWSIFSRHLFIVLTADGPGTLKGLDIERVSSSLSGAEALVLTNSPESWQPLKVSVGQMSENPLALAAQMEQKITAMACPGGL